MRKGKHSVSCSFCAYKCDGTFNNAVMPKYKFIVLILVYAAGNLQHGVAVLDKSLFKLAQIKLINTRFRHAC